MEFSIATLLANFSEDKLIAPKILEKKLAPDEDSARKFQVALDALERVGLLEKDKGRYRRIEQEGMVEAKLRCSSKGFCFAIQDVEGAEDVYIRESHLSTAWNGDRVLVKVIKEGSRRRSPEGEVYVILERANPSVLARVKQTKTGYWAVPLDDRLLFELELLNDDEELAGAVDHLVHVEVQRYPIGIHRPVGKVIQILGSDAEEADDLDIVCCKHDLLRSFSHRVSQEAEAIPAKPKKPDLKQRIDLREVFTFSFEPDLGNPEFSVMSKDSPNPTRSHVDHAFSLEKLKSGDWQVGIHLADPGHYITPDSALDREARKRGVSVFLADKLIPIFPESLSCDRLALLPDQERLTLSILVTLTEVGEIAEFEIRPSIIQVNHLLSYRQAQDILDDTQTVDPDLSSRLENLLEVSRLVRHLREQRGAFELNLLDTHRHFDDEGELGPMVTSAFYPAHSMVAELVILANQLVTSHLNALGLPAIYRAQPGPEVDDVAELVKLSNHLGCDFELKDEEEIQPIDFQNFVKALSASQAERVLTYLLEESLKPAVYSTTPKPHFGLSLDCYSHCTSPLSRYTDFQMLRVLKSLFEEGRDRRSTRSKEQVDLGHSDCHDKVNWNVLPPDLQADLEAQFGQLVVHLSERESVAADAEEDLEGLKKTGFMKERTGQVFTGLITGVQSYGFFVEIELESPGGNQIRVEGLVHVSSLKDDWYEYRSRQQTLVGRKNRNQYRLGDNVEVQVKSVDYYRQQIDLVAIGGGSEAGDEPDESFNF
ncbi:MAG: VacB/RNase II family 3'-5' exoribonuclease [Oscillatoriales cyanobacterium SM2_3_0]|nr:VacB/RNase II family 3'-5' exoribonuclease [Oscillatoriales cyanobacterium SM2_3_0]